MRSLTPGFYRTKYLIRLPPPAMRQASRTAFSRVKRRLRAAPSTRPSPQATRAADEDAWPLGLGAGGRLKRIDLAGTATPETSALRLSLLLVPRSNQTEFW